MQASIRAATSDDLDRLRAVELDAGERFRTIGLDVVADDDPPTVAALQAHVDAGTAWVAEVSGDDGAGAGAGAAAAEVVGYAAASVVDGEAHLDQVSLVGAAAGHRIGERLIEQVIAWARAQGLPTLTLTTFRDVPWNGPYYERLGFVALADDELGPELAEIRRAERAAGLDVAPRLAMRKVLTPPAQR